MPVLYNHTLIPQDAHREHSQAKYDDFATNGGLWGVRILGCSEASDTVQLDKRFKPFYEPMIEHLGRIGIVTAKEVIWDTDPAIARASTFANHELSVYQFGPTFNDLKPDLLRLSATNCFGDKNQFIRFCRDRYPVPRTFISDESSTDTVHNIPFPAWVKAAVSSAGVSLYRTTTPEEQEEAIEKVGDRYQIQQEVAEVDAFTSIQYQAMGGKLIHLATSNQLLSGVVHTGNTFPTHHDPHDITDSLAAELVEQGMKGVFAFDAAITKDDEVFLLECNPRWTGATYPTKIAKRLNLAGWMSCTLGTQLEAHKDIQLGNDEYDPTTKCGVIIVNSALMATHGIAGLLLAGPPGAQTEYRAKMREVFQTPEKGLKSLLGK